VKGAGVRQSPHGPRVSRRVFTLGGGALAMTARRVAAVEPAPAAHGIAMHGPPKYAADFTAFDYANAAAPKGGVLRQAIAGSFDNLHRYTFRGTAAIGLGLMHDTLLARAWDEPFTLYALIAETIRVAPDRSSIEFTLNPAARFHDGRPMTLDDLLWTVDILSQEGAPGTRSAIKRIASIETTGPRSVRFVFHPDADRESPLLLGLLPVLPKHYWQNRSFGQTTLEPTLGSGPYQITAVEPGRSLTYERVRDYWGASLPVQRGLHNFDTLRYDYFRDDAIALEAFNAGAYDLRSEASVANWALRYDRQKIRNGEITREELPHGRPDAMRAMIFNTRRPQFADIRVREALGLVLDAEWINRTLYYGALRRIDSYYPNSELAARGTPDVVELRLLEPWRTAIPPRVFGPAWSPPDGGRATARARLRRATALLRDAGATIEAGRLLQADGTPLRFEILLGTPQDEKLALSFAESVKALGITATVRTVDSAQFTARLETFDYDMVLHRWISTLSPGAEQLLYWSSAAAETNGSRNYAGIRSAAVDAVAGAIAAAEDRAGLVAAARALDRLLCWGFYTIPLFYSGRDLLAYRGALKRPSQIPIYGNVIESWWRG
jgi:microcin C transport system substrate-binding protein